MIVYYVYVLLGKDDRKFYIGYTNDLERRIKEHKLGKVRSTNERGVVDLMFYEAFASKLDAKRRERYFKTTKGRATLKLMLRETLV